MYLHDLEVIQNKSMSLWFHFLSEISSPTLCIVNISTIAFMSFLQTMWHQDLGDPGWWVGLQTKPTASMHR